MDENRQIRIITFRVGSESFVLDIMLIRQILAWTGSTPVPKAPEVIEGIIVVRNEVIPIVDLRKRLYPHLPPVERTPLVLIVETSYGAIGLKVDEVRRIITQNLDEILPAPELIRGLDGELFIGIIPRDDEIHLLIDVETLLTRAEKRQLAAADLEGVAESISSDE